MTSILGVDPGPAPGLVRLECRDGAVAFVSVVENLPPVDALVGVDWVAVERFIIGRATIRKTRAGSNEAHAQAEQVAAAARAAGKPLQYLPAGQVKPWATDARLKRYGLWEAMPNRHHRDAARHALVMAVKHGALPVLA